VCRTTVGNGGRSDVVLVTTTGKRAVRVVRSLV
jgi:hypothetical protein